MRVRYFADIRKLTGREEEELATPPATVRALLLALGERHGPAFRARLFQGGDPHRLSSTIILIVDGQNVVHLDGLDTRLDPAGVVAIFPMVAGG